MGDRLPGVFGGPRAARPRRRQGTSAFGCEMFDVNDAGSIKKHELALIVNAMNNVASWFGDPAVTPEEVDALCENVFLESKDGVVVNYGEVVHQIVEDPAFRTCLAGQGTVHYGSLVRRVIVPSAK